MILFLLLFFSPSNCQDDVYTWTNGLFTTSRTKNPALGEELYISARSHGPSWSACQFDCPETGFTWNVTDAGVIDQDGNMVQGVTGVKEEDFCSITIAKVNEDINAQLGDWVIQVHGEDHILMNLVITTDNEVSDGIRLPSTFTPLHYDVTLIPDLEYTPDGNQIKYEGAVTMTLESRYEHNPWLTFHMDELTPLGTPTVWRVDATGQTQVPIREIYFDFQRTFVHIRVRGAFESGEQVQVHVDFIADFTRDGYYTYGFYPQICSETNGDPKLCWFTQGESTTIRNAFPCLDEPAMKATFNLNIGRTENYHVRTNNPLVETVPIPDRPGYVLDKFETSVHMSPYLVAVAITDFISLASLDNSTAVWGPRDDIEAGRGDFANEIGSEIMSYYADYFHYWYPLPKMDLMYEAKKGGAMENWGLVLFAPRTIMLDAAADDEAKWLVINVISHELAHQVIC